MSVSEVDGLAQSPIVDEGIDYDVQIRTRSPSGTSGDWSPFVTLNATADISAPDQVDNLVVNSGLISWDQPASLNSIAARVYVNSINDFVTSTLVATIYGSPGVGKTFTVTDTPGTYYYFVTAINGSDAESISSDTGAVVVT
jgi:hypothetical protein